MSFANIYVYFLGTALYRRDFYCDMKWEISLLGFEKKD